MIKYTPVSIISLAFSTVGINKGHIHFLRIHSTQWASQDEPKPYSWPYVTLFKLVLIIHFPLAPTLATVPEPSNGFVGLRPVVLSCPGMFTVVALYQAGFICLHVEHVASGIEDPPACVDCQAVPAIWGALSRPPFSRCTQLQMWWAWRDFYPKPHPIHLTLNPAQLDEENMLGLGWEHVCFCRPCSVCRWGRTSW